MTTTSAKVKPARFPFGTEGSEYKSYLQHAADIADAIAPKAPALGHLPIFRAGSHAPANSDLPQGWRRKTGLLLGPYAEQVRIASVDNPAPDSSLGFAGSCLQLGSKESYVPGTLVVPLTAKRTQWLDPSSVRLFRWDAAQNMFVRLAATGVSANGGFAWGQVTATGTYVLIGLPHHPQALRMVAAIDLLSSLTSSLDAGVRADVHKSLTDGLLGSPELRKAVASPVVRDALWQDAVNAGLPLPGAEPLDASFGYLDDLIDRCQGLPTGLLPEGQLLPFTWNRAHFGSAVFRDEGWQSVGPVNIPGCAVQVLIDPTDSDRLYAGTSDGGLWTLPSVALYGDLTWTPLTDDNETLNAGAVAVAPSDGQVIYLIDGGGKVFVSRDQGRHWAATGAATLGMARRVLVDPADSRRLVAATSLGLHISTDAGATFTRSVAGDCTDFAVDPDDAGVQFLAIRGQGVQRSADGGTSWTTVLPWTQATSPSGSMIKVAVGQQGTTATRTVAVRLDQEVWISRTGGIPQTQPGGGPWVSRGQVGGTGYGDWVQVIAVDPFDDNVILSGAQELFRSSDGGESWHNVIGEYSDQHADQHSVVFDPTQRGVAYAANDGGIVISTDSGQTWRLLHWGMATAQLFPLAIQGNSAVTGMDHHGIQNTQGLASGQWAGPGGGGWEWARVYADPKRPDTYYVAVGTTLWRYRWPSPAPGGADLTQIGSFTPFTDNDRVTPFAVDPREDSNTAICGATDGALMRTLDITAESPLWVGVAGIAAPDGVAGVAFAPGQPSRVYAISGSGTVFRSDDLNGAAAWARAGQWAATSFVRQMVVNPLHAERLYAVSVDDVVMSTDAGGTWQSIAPSPAANVTGAAYRTVVAHPNDGRTLFVGSNEGVFISRNEGVSWADYGEGLPNANVVDVQVDSGYLYAATYGRGLWRRRLVL